jgi:uncharacterized protein (TIGR02246 family)
MARLRSWALAGVLTSSLFTLSSCGTGNPQTQSTAPPDTRAADEAAIRAMDADWVKIVAAKDVQKWASAYGETVSIFLPGAPLIVGKDAAQKALAGLVATPGFGLSFAPTKIEVSRSGDLAYEIGNYEMTTNDKHGKPQTAKAKYIVVWAKQADGSWKAVVDAPTTTQ